MKQEFFSPSSFLIHACFQPRQFNSEMRCSFYEQEDLDGSRGFLCATLLILGTKETAFFSNFSLRQLVEHSKSSAGLACDSTGGGGGGSKVGTGGIGFGGTRFNSHKSDSFGCRLKSNGPEDFETGLFAGLKLDVQQALRDNGAQITESGHPKPASFYFAYTLKNVRGRVQISGTRTGTDHYDIRADLDESGN